MKQITIYDAINEIKRELDMRKSVYPRLIQQNKLNSHRANLQYKALEVALEKLTELIGGVPESPKVTQQTLF